MINSILRTSQFKKDLKTLLKKHYAPETQGRNRSTLMSC